MSVPARTWSPGSQAASSTQWVAAMPEAKASAPHARLQRGERRFQGLARGVAAARVVELAPLAGARLDERRRQMDRPHDRAGLRIALVADVDRSGAELHGVSCLPNGSSFQGLFRSAIRSSAFSMPQDRRIMLSGMPTACALLRA